MSDIVIEDAPAVSVDPVATAVARLKEKYPEALQDDPRPGYTGVMVPADKIVEVAEYARQELGFNYLSSVTGVDLIDENKMEVVYHTYSIDQGQRAGAQGAGRPR